MSYESLMSHESPFLAFEMGRVMTRVIKSDDSSIHYITAVPQSQNRDESSLES